MVWRSGTDAGQLGNNRRRVCESILGLGCPKIFHEVATHLNCHYLIHDRDTKYCQSFRDIIESGDVKTLQLPVRSPNLNAFSERWVKSVKDDCLSKLILFGETSLRRALHDYLVLGEFII